VETNPDNLPAPPAPVDVPALAEPTAETTPAPAEPAPESSEPAPAQ
jgi:hypothetical protein